MAIYKDVVVSIERVASQVTIPNQGLTLLVDTTATKAYAEYADIQAVSNDYASGTPGYLMATSFFAQNPKPDKVAIVGVDKSTSFDDVITALNDVTSNHDISFVVVDDITEANQASMHTWAAAAMVMYVTVIPQARLGTYVDPASNYSVVLVHDDSTPRAQFADAALVSVCSGYEPGSATWKFKTLAGITPVVFTDQNAMVADCNTKHVNAYVAKYGQNMTTGGYTTSGEWVDVILGINWIRYNMEYNVWSVLKNATRKIAYDSTGIAQLGAAVTSTLKQATDMGIIRRDSASGLGEYSVQIPSITDVAVADIGARILRNVAWDATLAGAIHEVKISGTVHD